MTDYINSCIDLNYDYSVIADNSADGNEDWKSKKSQIAKIKEKISKMTEEQQVKELESRLKKFEESNGGKPSLSYLKVDNGYSFTVSYSIGDFVTK